MTNSRYSTVAEDIYANSRQDDGTFFMHEFGSWTEIRYKYA